MKPIKKPLRQTPICEAAIMEVMTSMIADDILCASEIPQTIWQRVLTVELNDSFDQIENGGCHE